MNKSDDSTYQSRNLIFICLFYISADFSFAKYLSLSVQQF